MTRNDFLSTALKAGLGCCALRVLAATPAQAADTASGEQVQRDKTFTDGWLIDLLDTMDAELDEATRIRLIEGCGRGCYRRHAFKGEIAVASGGTLGGLVEAYHRICEAWLEGDDELHVRFGEKSDRCYCPVLHDVPGRPNDLHCHCTKATHRMIIETALGRPVRSIEILESLRRGGNTCHFVARV